ncbi:hypothetical protein NDU88_001221 [Pleurodeles waltl]|uniref:Proteasome assembly chaperone 1 n=1 Tax=Pleurodeles waltl TaxID=8319 RepID=A0AAV7NBT1_PLEWA|nr:hypothetical protein NDU88_001221 [Pleurodeles waltl]
MATFFGEVVPVFSRAVDDDDEEEEEEVTEENEEDLAIRRELERQREVHVSWNSEISPSVETSNVKRFPCSHFVLAVGHNAAGFLSTYVLNSGRWEVAGSAKVWNERCTKSNPRPGSLSTDSSCVFYRMVSDPTILVCQCTSHVAEDQQFQWCEKVFSCMEKTHLKVTVLSTCPVASYKTTESVFTLPVPFLKALSTMEFTQETSCSRLEQPNIVDGLPAAVLSYCQVWQIPAVLYQCYTDAIKLDSITIDAFRPVLSHQNLCSFSTETSNSEEILKKIVTSEEIQSNLYT